MNDTYNWVRAIHVFGFLIWTGALMSTLHLLQGQQTVADSGRAALSNLSRRTAMMMDMGALIAIGAGLYLALGMPGINAFKQGAWLHVKSTLVVGLVAIHVFTRIKVRKFRNGNVKPLPGFVIPLTLILIAIIVVFGVIKPLS